MKPGVLVLNAGSSSVKFAAFQVRDGAPEQDAVLRGQIAGIGREPSFQVREHGGQESTRRLDAEQVPDHRAAIDWILAWLEERQLGLQWQGVGHRLVHGGGRDAPTRVDATVLAELQRLAPLAPHHQPHNLAAVQAMAEAAPSLPQVACFDTAFHANQPEVARLLPLPADLRDRGLVRYGFHGLSYQYVVSALPDLRGAALPQRLVIAHLGNGASVCAVRDGRSIATSMGFSTLDGLVMGTRCGSLDPGVLLHLMRECGYDETALTDLLYNRSGLLGVSGVSADMRVLLDSEDPAAGRAVELFCYALVRTIGSMTAALGGIDALVFTGGIGEHAPTVRARVCDDLAWLGVQLDRDANAFHSHHLSRADSAVEVWVVPANEELAIARQVCDVLAHRGAGD